MPASARTFDRAVGALTGIAIGDAVGMPSQTLSREQIKEFYGEITDFLSPVDNHPVSHGLKAGQITDDTEQTVILAQLLIEGVGQVDECSWANALLEWEANVKRRGLRDLLGPSSKRALEALLLGAEVSETGKAGTTNGAAMRIAPIGISVPPDDISLLVKQVAAVCRVTHATREAIASASAVAMIISKGVNGSTFYHAIPDALKAAQLGAMLGEPVGESNIAEKIIRALKIAEQGDEYLLADHVGTSVASHESIPAAFGVVALADGDPWKAALIAANIGDDTDTIASMACAMASACCGLSALPQDKVEKVNGVNSFNFEQIATELLLIRDNRLKRTMVVK